MCKDNFGILLRAFDFGEIAGKFFTVAVAMAFVFGVVFLGGCSFSTFGSPRPRLGSYATSTPGTNFIDLDNIGRHCYDNSLFENNGIVYTCRGGHIDIAHLRICADYTRYIRNKTFDCLKNDKTQLSFKLNVEPSTYFVKFTYPDNWDTLPPEEKEKAIPEISLELGQYFTFMMTTWHEVLTYYGYKCMAVLPEEPSAFSWEDIYSNLVGIRLGARAVVDTERNYDEAMTAMIREELENLQIQSRHAAWQASEKMRGIWFEGFMLIDMKERNFDIGTDDGMITPVLVPDVCENVEPQSYPVPTLEAFNRYGFTMKFEVEPKEFEKDKILRIIYPDGGGKRIQPTNDLPIIVEHIKKERKQAK